MWSLVLYQKALVAAGHESLDKSPIYAVHYRTQQKQPLTVLSLPRTLWKSWKMSSAASATQVPMYRKRIEEMMESCQGDVEVIHCSSLSKEDFEKRRIDLCSQYLYTLLW